MAPPLALTNDLFGQPLPLMLEQVQVSPRVKANTEGRDFIDRVLAYAAHMEQQLNDQRQRIAELEALSQTDELTGLPNRRAFDDFLMRTLNRARRYGEVGVVSFFDVDHFKLVNDQFGHAVGDAALRYVARELKARTRQTDFVARLHGDEFALILVQAKPKIGMRRLRQIVEDIAQQIFPLAGYSLSLKLSFGGVVYGPESQAEDLMRLADERMYVSKRTKTA